MTQASHHGINGIVAIVGRPNVGKSTLFNRLTGSDDAIVDDRPGVTRDRIYGSVRIGSPESGDAAGFLVVDTGGFEKDDFKFQPFAENLVWRQTEAAIQECDLVLLILDAKAGMHPHDKELVRYLDRLRKPYLVAVNKVDGMEQGQVLWDFYEIGLDESTMKLSAAHNRGVGDLKEALVERLATIPSVVAQKDSEGATRIAIVGRPNAGKSSIVNRLLGEERALVSEIAGTTRDSLDTPMTYNGQAFVLVDTAGIRRKSRINERVEALSVMRSLRAIERADVVLLILDAQEGLTEQDMRLADLATERSKPIAIVMNKWDLVADKSSNSTKDWTDAVHRTLKTMAYAPVAFVSCLENQRIHKLMALVEKLAKTASRRVGTTAVNQALRTMVQEHTPALIKGKTKRVKFYFATQVSVSPPTIVVFCNVAKEIHESYMRYMTNRFRDMLGFEEIPIRLFFRSKEEVRARDVREAAVFEATDDGQRRRPVIADDEFDGDDDTAVVVGPFDDDLDEQDEALAP